MATVLSAIRVVERITGTSWDALRKDAPRAGISPPECQLELSSA